MLRTRLRLRLIGIFFLFHFLLLPCHSRAEGQFLDRLLQAFKSPIFHTSDNLMSATELYLWQRTYGGNRDDSFQSVQQTSDGGFILAGWTDSFGTSVRSACLVKTDDEGNLLWQRTFGGNRGGVAKSVQQTSDGGYAVAGTRGFSWNGGEDAYLVKTDGEGNVLWERVFGGTDNDGANAMLQTADGGYLLAGTANSSNARGAYLVKTDHEGNLLWERSFGAGGFDNALALQNTSDGGYILAGRMESFDARGTQACLVKTDREGNLLWQRDFGGSESDLAFSVQQTSDGGYILAGGTGSFGSGIADIYLVKTDSEGDLQWFRAFGSPNLDGANCVQQTFDDGYILAGFTQPLATGSMEAYLVRTDADGNFLWHRGFGGIGLDVAYSLEQTSDGGYVVAGSTMIIGRSGYYSADTDGLLVKTYGDEVTGEGEGESEEPPRFYYWSKWHNGLLPYYVKVPLEVFPWLITLKFKEGVAFDQQLSILNAATVLYHPPVAYQGGGRWVEWTEDLPSSYARYPALFRTSRRATEESVLAAVDSFNQLPQIQYAHPVFNSPEHPDWACKYSFTDEFTVHFMDGILDEQIETMNARNGVILKERDRYDPSYMVFRVIANILDRAAAHYTILIANALDMANKYYESGVAVSTYTHPISPDCFGSADVGGGGGGGIPWWEEEYSEGMEELAESLEAEIYSEQETRELECDLPVETDHEEVDSSGTDGPVIEGEEETDGLDLDDIQAEGMPVAPSPTPTPTLPPQAEQGEGEEPPPDGVGEQPAPNEPAREEPVLQEDEQASATPTLTPTPPIALETEEAESEELTLSDAGGEQDVVREPEPEEAEPEPEVQSPSPTPTQTFGLHEDRSFFCPMVETTASTALATQLDALREWRDALLANKLGEWTVARYYLSRQ